MKLLRALLWLTFGVVAAGGLAYLTLVSLRGPAAFAAVVLRLALIVLAVVVSLMVLNIVLRVIDDRRGRRLEREYQAARDLIRELLAAPADPARRAPLKPYLKRLDIIEEAGRTFSGAERDALRRVLLEMGAAGPLEREARQSAGKWRRVRALALLGWLGSETSLLLFPETLYDPDPDIGYTAANALGRYNLKTAYQALVGALGAGSLAPSRLAAILESSEYRSPLPLLVEAAGDRDPKVRFWVAYLLGRTGDRGAFPALASLAGDEDANVRTNAAEALGKIGDRRAVPLVKTLLGDDTWFVRAHAAKAVGALGDEGLIADLLPLLRDSQWWVRQNAALALEKLGGPAVPHLIKLLRDRDRFAGNKAAEVLVRLGVVSQKIADLTGPPSRAREAHDFLTAIGRAEAVDFLQEATERATGQSQSRLAEILGEIGDPRSLPLLEKLSLDGDRSVGDPAKRAVRQIRKAV